MRYLCTRFEGVLLGVYSARGSGMAGGLAGEKKSEKFFFETLAGEKRMVTFAARFVGAGGKDWGGGVFF
jgi:hypothetical protein